MPSRPGTATGRSSCESTASRCQPVCTDARAHGKGSTSSTSTTDPLTLARGETRTQRGEEILVAPMPGVVVEIHVAQGDVVGAGQTLLVIESMKLQTAIASEIAGRVSELPLAPGDGFEQAAMLARIEPAPVTDEREDR